MHAAAYSQGELAGFPVPLILKNTVSLRKARLQHLGIAVPIKHGKSANQLVTLSEDEQQHANELSSSFYIAIFAGGL